MDRLRNHEPSFEEKGNTVPFKKILHAAMTRQSDRTHENTKRKHPRSLGGGI